MFDGGKFWRIRRIKASSSKFSLSIFNNLSASACNIYGSHKSAYWSRITSLSARSDGVTCIFLREQSYEIIINTETWPSTGVFRFDTYSKGSL